MNWIIDHRTLSYRHNLRPYVWIISIIHMMPMWLYRFLAPNRETGLFSFLLYDRMFCYIHVSISNTAITVDVRVSIHNNSYKPTLACRRNHEDNRESVNVILPPHNTSPNHLMSINHNLRLQQLLQYHETHRPYPTFLNQFLTPPPNTTSNLRSQYHLGFKKLTKPEIIRKRPPSAWDNLADDCLIDTL